MLWLSEILMKHHELDSFNDLIGIVRDKGQQGEMFFRMDVRPPFQDTPEDWEDRLEGAFTSARKS